MKEPLLSIVITSYTMERFKDICDLFDSIKLQTYQNLEVIFVAERSRELYEKVKLQFDLASISSLALSRPENALSWIDQAGVLHRAIPKLSYCEHIKPPLIWRVVSRNDFGIS